MAAQPNEAVALYVLDDRLSRIEAQLARLLEDRSKVTEMWLDKSRLAEEIGMSPRWIEARVSDGMPCRRIGKKCLFRLSHVEGWLRSQGHLREDG